MIDTTIQFPANDMMRLDGAIKKAVKELGKDMKDAVGWAGGFVADSLSASTKIAPKLRKIVRNPDQRYKTDARRAPFGVMRFKKDGTPYFKPIYRTGEFGRVRFVDKHTLEIKYINTLTGKVHRADRFEQVPGLSIKTDKRRVIGRRKLAKKTWQWAKKHINRTSSGNVLGIGAAASIRWRGGNSTPTLTITNNLRYATDAFKTKGARTVDTAVERAANKMVNRVEDRIDKQLARI